MSQNAFQVLNGRLQKFDILGRYFFIGGTSPTNENQTGTRNLHTEYILNHTGELEIWKSTDDKSMIVHSWTEEEYESENVYLMDVVTDEDEDWRVCCAVSYAAGCSDLVIVQWTSRSGEQQTVRYELYKEKLFVTITGMGINGSSIIMYKNLDYKPEEF